MSVPNKGRILIVDDELVVRDSLARWFTAEGYETKPMASAREALEVATQEWDLALLDIKMPGMDGMELEAKLKESDPDLILIMMTGYATVDTAVKALKNGAYDYLANPWIRTSFRTWWPRRWSTGGRSAKLSGCKRT